MSAGAAILSAEVATGDFHGSMEDAVGVAGAAASAAAAAMAAVTGESAALPAATVAVGIGNGGAGPPTSAAGYDVEDLRRVFYDKLGDVGRSQLTRQRKETVIRQLREIQARQARQPGKFNTDPEAKISYHHRNAYRVYCLIVNTDATTGVETYDLALRKDVERNVRRPVAAFEDWFDIIRDEHDRSQHKGVAKVFYGISRTYARLAREAVAVYGNLCPLCTDHRDRKRTKDVVYTYSKTAVSYCNERWHIEVLEMNAADGPFHFLCHIQDHHSKYSRIRPLEDAEPPAVANALFDAVIDFGLPTVIHVNDKIVEELSTDSVLAAYDGICRDRDFETSKIIRGADRSPTVQAAVDTANNQVLHALAAWESKNKSSNWAVGCKMVQLIVNTAVRPDTNRAPLEVFCNAATTRRNGVHGLGLAAELVANVETEEDLERVAPGILTSAEAVVTAVPEPEAPLPPPPRRDPASGSLVLETTNLPPDGVTLTTTSFETATDVAEAKTDATEADLDGDKVVDAAKAAIDAIADVSGATKKRVRGNKSSAETADAKAPQGKRSRRPNKSARV